MFRSDRKPNGGQVSVEPVVTRIEIPTWQEPPPPAVEKPVATRPVDPPTQPRAISERDALARDIKDGVLNGFVGSGTVMTGESVFKGMLRVDGHLTGHVVSEDGTLIVGANGKVDANVDVSIATIHGQVNGDIVATKRIEIGRSAKVIGNIQTPALVVEPGAVFEGKCRMTTVMSKDDKARKDKIGVTKSSLMPSAGEMPEISDIAS